MMDGRIYYFVPVSDVNVDRTIGDDGYRGTGSTNAERERITFPVADGIVRKDVDSYCRDAVVAIADDNEDALAVTTGSKSVTMVSTGSDVPPSPIHRNSNNTTTGSRVMCRSIFDCAVGITTTGVAYYIRITPSTWNQRWRN